MSDVHRLRHVEEQLFSLLGPQLAQIIHIVNDPEYLIQIPDADDVDLTLEEMMSIVARTSNNFGRIARFAGMARAEAKLAKGRYERKFKQNRVGKNEDERTAKAMAASEDEHAALTTAEAIADMADSFELAARIASESARKILDKIQSMNIASAREAKGAYRESDFSTY